MIFEIGLPRKTFTSIKRALKFINLYNGKKKALFKSVYLFREMNENKPNYKTAIIDKLFFDFDSENCWSECNRLHKYLLKEDIKHLIVMSGRGYHLLISASSVQLNNPKSTIYNAQMFFVDKLNLDCDRQVIGDYSRLKRIPNTYHSIAHRFCIHLTKKDFEGGHEYCKKLAKKQNFKKEYIGKKIFDISKFDYKINKLNDIEINIDSSSDISNIDYMKKLPTTIKALLQRKNLGWNERYLIILYFKERGYTKHEVYNILKKHLSEQKFIHCIKEERQLQYLFTRDDLMFPEKYGKVYK